MFAGIACSGILLILAGQPAGAAGNASLDRDIIADPVPGWIALPATQVNQTVDALQGVEAAASKGTGLATSIAAEAWRDPASTSTFVFVILVGLSAPGQSPESMAGQADAAAKAAAATFCAGVSGSVPLSDVPLASIPQSHQAVCENRARNGMQISVVTWGKANVFALVFASTGLERLDAIAQREYTAMPTAGSSSSGGSTNLWVVALPLAAVALVGAGLSVIVARRRRVGRAAIASGAAATDFPASAYPDAQALAPPPSGPPAGWYPDPTDPGRMRYFTGSDWGPQPQPSADQPD